MRNKFPQGCNVVQENNKCIDAERTFGEEEEGNYQEEEWKERIEKQIRREEERWEFVLRDGGWDSPELCALHRCTNW